MLGPALVRREKRNNEDIIKPVSILPNVIELTYYSNTVITYYALESIVAIALSSLPKKAGCVTQRDLIDASLDLCNILQYEFILRKPCQSLEVTIVDCIGNLILRKDLLILVSTKK